ALSIAALTSIAAAQAESLDDKKPLICAALDARSCADDGECTSGQPSEFNAPRFLRVDFAGKAIRSERPDGGSRNTTIDGNRTVGDRIVLNGFDEGLEGAVGWNIVINQNGGDMTLAVAGAGISLTVFGSCTALEIMPTAASK